MTLKVLQFAAIILVAVSLVPGGAHLIELPNKITLEKEPYLIVQQLYRGWALAAIPLFGALLATLALAVQSRSQTLPLLFATASFVLLLITLITFFIWIYPVNQATSNWTMAPENWQVLRNQWEYTHAINAAVTSGALICAVLSVLTWSSE